MKLKTNHIYKHKRRGKDQVFLVVKIRDRKTKIHPVHVLNIDGHNKGKTNLWKEEVTHDYVVHLGHKDDLPEYFI